MEHDVGSAIKLTNMTEEHIVGLDAFRNGHVSMGPQILGVGRRGSLGSWKYSKLDPVMEVEECEFEDRQDEKPLFHDTYRRI